MAEKTPRRVTIIDIAREAEVSPSTVSLVLRKSGRISPATVQRVQEAIRKFGYKYNRVAANLRQQKSQLISLVINDIRNPFFAELTAGVQEALQGSDILLFLVDTNDDEERQAAVCRSVEEYGIGGLIIFPVASTKRGFLEDIASTGTPVCVILRRPSDTNVNYIGPDNRQAALIATRHLVGLGHRRIAFLGGQEEGPARIDRIAGYRAALEEVGIAYDRRLDIVGKPTREDSMEITKRLLTQDTSVTAALCYNDNVAITAMHVLHTMGKQAGRDFSIVGIDGIIATEQTSPPLTTVSMHAAEIGRRAATLLLERMKQGNSDMHETVTLQPTLIVRGSCAKPSATQLRETAPAAQAKHLRKHG
jgi:LacI family transcriptional regulator